MRKKCQESLINWVSHYLQWDPTTDCKQISEEENNDNTEKGAIFYSAEGWVVGVSSRSSLG
jgi:hypothetical protein